MVLQFFFYVNGTFFGVYSLLEMEIISEKQKQQKSLLLKRRGKLGTNYTEKADILKSFFTSTFTSTVGPQALRAKIQANANTLTINKGRADIQTITGA